MKAPDDYDIFARYIPTAICALPALVLYCYLLQPHFHSLFSLLGGIKVAGYLIVPAAAMYFIMQLNNRLVGKILQRRIFRSGRIPTTQLLMADDPTFSDQRKLEIANKFKADFNKDLPVTGGHLSDENRRKRITELTSHIRDSMRDNKLVRNHNIEYGFVRNLCGGSFGAILICLANLLIFGLIAWSKPALVISVILLVAFSIIAALSKPLITVFGQNYAHVLYEQYLSSK